MSKELEVELTKDSVKLSVGKEPTQALTRGLGDIFGLVTESFGIFKDKIRDRRKINQLKFAKKIQEEAKSLNLTVEQFASIDLRELAVIEQHAILEEDETLQSMWARLIVDSVNNNEDKDNLTFMNILKEITPLQAKILKFYYEVITNTREILNLNKVLKAVVVKNEILRHLDIDEDIFTFNASALMRLGLITQSDTPSQVLIGGGTVPTGYNKTTLTPLGFEFVKKCIGNV